MLAFQRLIACLAPLAVMALGGCGFVSQSRLDGCQMQNRALAEKNQALAAEVQNLKVNRDHVLEKLEKTEEDLSLLQEQVGVDRKGLADFRQRGQQLRENYQSLLAGRSPIAPETRKRLAEISQRYPALRFDPQTGVSKLDTDILFDSGKAELKPGAEQLLGELVRLLKSPEAGDFKILVVGHTDDRQVAKKPAREQFPNNFHLSAERALSVCDQLHQLGLPEERLGLAGLGAHEPIAQGTSATDRQKNRRVEIFVMAPEVPIVGWTETTPTLY